MRHITAAAVLLGAFIALPSLAQKSEAPAVSVQSEISGWFDVVLPILEEQPIVENGKRLGTAVLIGGVLDGQKISIAVGILDDWEEAKLTPAPSFRSYVSSVLFERVGSSSDRFVRGLADVYKQPNRDLIARDQVAFEAISLTKDPRPIGSTPIDAKVFVEGGGPEDYGEFYLIVDWKSRVVTIKEKDPEYRPAILKALSNVAR